MNMSILNILEIGGIKPYFKQKEEEYNLFILNNVDNEIFLKYITTSSYTNMFIYYGSFFDIGAKNATIIIPNLTFFETDGIHINLEGRIRKTVKVINNVNNFNNITF
jgi:NADH dehydrogenase/NADH:ubiquinone oxidoreductase subunit G